MRSGRQHAWVEFIGLADQRGSDVLEWAVIDPRFKQADASVVGHCASNSGIVREFVSQVGIVARSAGYGVICQRDGYRGRGITSHNNYRVNGDGRIFILVVVDQAK